MNIYSYYIQLHITSELGHLTQANELVPTDRCRFSTATRHSCLTLREASLHNPHSLGMRVADYISVLTTMKHQIGP